MRYCHISVTIPLYTLSIINSFNFYRIFNIVTMETSNATAQSSHHEYFSLRDVPLKYSDFFLNRDLCQLEFNRRVLAQAEDESVPLLERLRFLCIFSNNLDEFFEIRIASLKEQIKSNPEEIGPDGLTPLAVYEFVSLQIHELVERQFALLNTVLLPALAAEKIFISPPSEWSQQQSLWVHDYFRHEVLPLLTPISIQPNQSFPRILNKSMNFLVELSGKDDYGRHAELAMVPTPRSLPRVIPIPSEVAGNETTFVSLASIMQIHVKDLFLGMQVMACHTFRLTRNSELFIDEEETQSLIDKLRGELPRRHYGHAVRLEVSTEFPEQVIDYISKKTQLTKNDIYYLNGSLNLARWVDLPNLVNRPDLKFPEFVPGVPRSLRQQSDIFAAIRKQDILLHHPYESFAPVVDFIRAAAYDPDVLAIRQTIYRTGHDSALLEALCLAAQRGKAVVVVVELFARFDEETNVNWAERLERTGVNVIYGTLGIKTHAKMAMVIRREQNQLKRYVHLGTGNYHSRTARIYTDFGLFTCNDEICADVNEVFTQLTGLGKAGKLHRLYQSPFTLHRKLVEKIKFETAQAITGKATMIIAKMNALLEPEIIQALYTASQAGVKIHLIVRGMCVLRPGVKDLSENITVRSIVGRFLEHHRIFYFFNNGQEDIYLSSADWMDRNFFRRVEIAFPILDQALKKRIVEEGLKACLKDNTHAWLMGSDGKYKRLFPRSRKYSAHEVLLKKLKQ
jgi:polyphosphate kinase